MFSPSISTLPLLGITKRGSKLTTVVLPLPERPTKATRSPAWISRLKLSSALRVSWLYCTSMFSNFRLPETWFSVLLPVSCSVFSSKKSHTASDAKNMLCMGMLMLAKFLIGLSICNMATINAINSPMVVTPFWLCHRAIKITTARASEAMSSLNGERAAVAWVIFLPSRTMVLFTSAKRPAACCCPPNSLTT